MVRLNVSVEIEGKLRRAGMITGERSDEACFCYDTEYLNIPGIRPISISLPLQEEAFSPVSTKCFFEGLLPEGFSRKAVASWAKADENDYLSILKVLGLECLGAIQISEGDISDHTGVYEELSEEQVKALAAEGATKSTELLMETHLSLTGATGKVGLYYDHEAKKWYLPKGTMASTHIVKQSHVRLDQIVLNEQLCLMTAKKLGIQVPDSFIINEGAGEDENILFATQRYDRIIRTKKEDGAIRSPLRLHQEDFAQAMKIPAFQKYETEKQGFMRRMFEVLRNYSENPIEDELKLWDIIVYHYLIGNTDGHIKNFSLLYDEKLSGLRLAPAYDIVSTRAYGSTDQMAFYIGGKLNFKEMKRETFADAAHEIGIGERIAIKRFDVLAQKFQASLLETGKELAASGLDQAEKMAERILAASGYARL